MIIIINQYYYHYSATTHASAQPFPLAANKSLWPGLAPGVLQELQGNASSVCDLIPVDHTQAVTRVCSAGQRSDHHANTY